MKTFAISIPKPCHEDWNKMTPDAKGAFCGSCQKSVYDFSNKTDEEIISVFEKEEKGKVCGRFAPAQLSRPVISFGNPSSTSRLAIFACALLLVFGAALFNGAEAFGQDIKGDVKVERLGRVAVTEIIPVKEKAIENPVPVKQTTLSVCEAMPIADTEIMSLGQAMVMEEPITKTMGDTIIEISEITGETEFIPIKEVIIDSIEPVEPIELINYIAGGISYIEIIETAPIENTVGVDSVISPEPLIIPDDTTGIETALVSETFIIPPPELTIKVSPNPSSGEIKISYNLETIMSVRIDLFDISGKLVRTLTKQQNQYPGKYNVSYNIADLPNGIYNAVLLTSDRRSSAKVILTK